MTKWLEPSVEKRILEVTDSCCQSDDMVKLHQMFTSHLQELKSFIPLEYHSIIFELESIFNTNMGVIINLSYRSGFEDGMKLIKHFHVK